MSNKVSKNKGAVQPAAKPKKKGSALIYGAVGLIVGVLVLSFFTGILNTAAEKGIVNVVTESASIVPYAHTVKEVTGGNETVYPFYEIEDLPENIPEIKFTDPLYIKYEGKTLNDFSFFMYSKGEKGEIKSVYENVYQFTHPKNSEGNIIPGEYIVKFKFSWGSNDKNYITREHFFKIIYE